MLGVCARLLCGHHGEASKGGVRIDWEVCGARLQDWCLCRDFQSRKEGESQESVAMTVAHVELRATSHQFPSALHREDSRITWVPSYFV
jgi:hypothetical protein